MVAWLATARPDLANVRTSLRKRPSRPASLTTKAKRLFQAIVNRL